MIRGSSGAVKSSRGSVSILNGTIKYRRSIVYVGIGLCTECRDGPTLPTFSTRREPREMSVVGRLDKEWMAGKQAAKE